MLAKKGKEKENCGFRDSGGTQLGQRKTTKAV
jgi:hypothetical protein